MKAKLFCSSVKHHIGIHGDTLAAEVYLNGVYGTSGENKDFWDATPNAQFNLTITNPATFSFFKPGENYYITFTPES